MPASVPDLARDEVHVWSIALSQAQQRVHELSTLLAEDERERAARFQFESLRRRFIVAHGAVRLLLAEYTGVVPQALQFTYGSFGKPALTSPRELRFNLSHAEELALLAITREHEVGVDVEHLRPVSEMDQIARSNFSPNEVAALLRLEARQRQLSFFNCWTRKEAFIKAHGAGLSMPLDRFEVSFVLNEKARLLTIDGDKQRAAQWSLLALHPAEGYVAALAVAAPKVKVLCRRWA